MSVPQTTTFDKSSPSPHAAGTNGASAPRAQAIQYPPLGKLEPGVVVTVRIRGNESTAEIINKPVEKDKLYWYPTEAHGTICETWIKSSVMIAWDLFKRDGAVVEIRALLKTKDRYQPGWEGWGDIITGWFDDYEAFYLSLKMLERYGKAKSIYTTLNPVSEDLAARAYNRLIAVEKDGQTTQDQDITRRCHLLLDADPIRPSGVSATDAELEAACARMEEAEQHLTRLGWPEPIRARSGNGPHRIYPISLPNDDASRDLIAAVLNALQLQFGDKENDTDIGAELVPGQIGVKIDTSVYNASRITKAYGTTARKGDDIPTRPHRPSYIESVPTQLALVTRAQLEEVAVIWTSYEAALKAEEEKKREEARAKRRNATGDDVDVIALFNESHDIEDLLTEYGYTQKRPGSPRWSRPGQPESNGVLVDKRAQKAYAYSDNDPMKNGHRFDCFDLRTQHGHNGDRKEAYIAVKKELNLWKPSAHDEANVEACIGLHPHITGLHVGTNGNSDQAATAPATQPAPLAPEAATALAEHAIKNLYGLLDENSKKSDAKRLLPEKVIWQWCKDWGKELIALTPEQLDPIKTALLEAGQSQRWIDTGFPQIIKQSYKRSLPLSQQIEADLQDWNYDLWLNDMDDSLWNGDKRMDDPARCTLRALARDNSYGGQGNRKSLEALEDNCIALAAKNRKHPIRDWLNALGWDRQDHIGKLASFFDELPDDTGKAPMIHYKDGTERTRFHAFLRRWLINAVAKQMGDRNAVGNNFILVLAMEQGRGKSHFANWLCPLKDYFVEKSIAPDNRDTSLLRTRIFVWEIMELGATTKKADVEALKGFVTGTMTTERKAYGHFETVKPSVASYIGTINPDGSGFLSDTTGNRRFAVVDLADIRWKYSAEVDPAQVWAQAVALWKEDGLGYRWTDEEAQAQAASAEAHMETDVMADMIRRVYEINPQENDWRASSSEILEALRTYAGLSRGHDKVQAKDLAKSLKSQWGIVGKRSHGLTYYKGLKRLTGLASVAGLIEADEAAANGL